MPYYPSSILLGYLCEQILYAIEMSTFWFLPFMVVAATAIVCPPCHDFNCDSITSCENGYVKEKGGFCGCCDTCVTYIEEGKHCWVPNFLGMPVNSECKPGLYCDQITQTCKFALKVQRTSRIFSCKENRDEIIQGLKDGFMIGVNLPQCDDDDTYSAKQCIEAVCYCVNKYGQPLKEYSGNIGLFTESTCKCAREEDYLSSMLGKRVKCNDVGNYESFQCVGSQCYCADYKDGHQIGNSVHISEYHKLNC